jgi:hypothetical protein
VNVAVKTAETEHTVIVSDRTPSQRPVKLHRGRGTFQVLPGEYSLMTLPSYYQPPPEGAVYVWAGEDLELTFPCNPASA